ncbi:MAG: GNAT family N-acetyltransferase [Planctomycetota bacterium]|nr:GNAT family N-acetyltransferase [Planctomycetota bacterium]
MIQYRVFQNTDPPQLAEVWRASADRVGLAQPMSTELFELHVLNKPYFDRQGLIVALSDDRIVGFVHSGFGPNDNESGVSVDFGVTSLLLVRPQYQNQGIEVELLSRSEAYLRSRGATVLYGGSIWPLNPFYLGLYGGSEMSGVLDSDQSTQQLFLTNGYKAIDRSIVFQRTTADFRAPIDRKFMQIRRRSQVAIVNEPPLNSWWQACILGEFERTEFQLLDRTLGNTLASATFRDLDFAIAAPNVRASGLIEVHADPDSLRQGLATFLLAEAFKQLSEEGIGLIESVTMERNAAARGLYQKLGFQQVAAGNVYRKDASQR